MERLRFSFLLRGLTFVCGKLGLDNQNLRVVRVDERQRQVEVTLCDGLEPRPLDVVHADSNVHQQAMRGGSQLVALGDALLGNAVLKYLLAVALQVLEINVSGGIQCVDVGYARKPTLADGTANSRTQGGQQ